MQQDDLQDKTMMEAPYLEPSINLVSDAPLHLVPGQILSDRYKVIEEIGAGCMGRVYKVEHLLLNKVMAVKILHNHLTGDAQSLERFKVEAKAASNLRHENLVAVTEYGVTESKQPFIVMDYVDGETLQSVLTKSGSLSSAEFKTVFEQVARGLAHANECGVIHRDLKPSNIILSRGNNETIKARILDFGIAKIMPQGQDASQQLTQTGALFGSPLYMSPEQCQGGPIDFRSDIYSLGCVMYEALTGNPPFRGKSLVETLYQHINAERPIIGEAFLQIPLDLQNLIAKCLAKDPKDRPTSARELADEIARANLAVSSSSLSLASSVSKPAQSSSSARIRRNWTLAAVVSLLIVLVYFLGLLIDAPTLSLRQNGFRGYQQKDSLDDADQFAEDQLYRKYREPPADGPSPSKEIKRYQKAFADNPRNYNEETNNELRHYYIQFDSHRAAFHTDLILSHQPMQDYMMHMLSSWSLGKDDDLAIANYQSVMSDFQEFPHIQAACMIEVAQILQKKGELDDAKKYLQDVLSLRGSNLQAYKFLAKEKLKTLK